MVWGPFHNGIKSDFADATSSAVSHSFKMIWSLFTMTENLTFVLFVFHSLSNTLFSSISFLNAFRSLLILH